MTKNEFAVPGNKVELLTVTVWWSQSVQCCCLLFFQKNTLEAVFCSSTRNNNNNIHSRRSVLECETTRNFLKILHCHDDDDGRKRMTKTTQLRHKKWVFRMWIFFSFFYCLMNTQNFSPLLSLLSLFSSIISSKRNFCFFFCSELILTPDSSWQESWAWAWASVERVVECVGGHGVARK